MKHDADIGRSRLPSEAACNICSGAKARHLFTKNGFDLVECQSCGLAYIANPPDQEGVAGIYTATADYHTGLLDPGSGMFARMGKIARQHMRALRKQVSEGSNRSLLDIGCSSGLFLAEARDAGFTVEGLELSPQTSAFAREHFGLKVTDGLLDDAGFADESFDVVTLFDVIEHVPDPLDELARVRRILRPGGLLMLSTPNIDGLFPRASHALAKRLDYWPHPEPPHHLFQFSVRTMRAMLEKAGFEPGAVQQTRIDLDYSFGTPAAWKASPKMLAYAALFAPLAIAGPWLGMGDWFYLAARRT